MNVTTTLSMKHSTFYDSNDPFNGEHTQLYVPYSFHTDVHPSHTTTVARVLASSARSNNVPAAFLQLGTSGNVKIFIPARQETTLHGCAGQCLRRPDASAA